MTDHRATPESGLRTPWKLRALVTSPSLWALAMIAAQFGLRWPGTRDSWFYSDDLLFLSDIGAGIDDPAWYFHTHFGHLMPLSFALTEMVARTGPYNWQAAAVQIAVMQALAGVGIWVMLRVLFGSRLLLLLPFGVYLFGAAGAAASTWWAVAINQLPHQVALAGAVCAHVLYLRTHHRRWVLVTFLFLLLGFGTYTKTVLLPFVLLFLTVTYFHSGTLAHRIRATARREWIAWVPYAALLAVYVAVYLRALPDDERPPLSPAIPQFVVDHLLITTPTTLTGGPWNWAIWMNPMVVADPPLSMLVAGWVILAGVTCVVTLRRQHAAVAAALPLGYALISLAFIVQSRNYVVIFDGPERLGRHVQYLADLIPIAALALALMLMPLRGAANPSTPRTPEVLRLPWSRPVRWGLAATLTSAVLIAAIGSNLHYATSWRGTWDQRTFFTTAIDEVEQNHPLLADTIVPESGMSSLAFTYKPIRVALSPLSDQFTVSDAGVGLQMFTEEGDLARADVDAGDRRTDTGSCQEVDDQGGWVDIVATIDYSLWTAVDVQTRRPTTVAFGFGSRHVKVNVAAGRHTVLVHTPRGYDTVWVRPEAGTSVCVEAVRVGELRPRSAR